MRVEDYTRVYASYI